MDRAEPDHLPIIYSASSPALSFMFLLTQDPLIPTDRNNFLLTYHFHNPYTPAPIQSSPYKPRHTLGFKHHCKIFGIFIFNHFHTVIFISSTELSIDVSIWQNNTSFCSSQITHKLANANHTQANIFLYDLQPLSSPANWSCCMSILLCCVEWTLKRLLIHETNTELSTDNSPPQSITPLLCRYIVCAKFRLKYFICSFDWIMLYKTNC
jgi:hypothetical protein